MNRSPLLLILIGVFAVVAVAGITNYKPGIVQPSVASDTFWSGDMHDNYYSHCMSELTHSDAGTLPDVVHSAICDCQIAEAERWLRPTDMTIVLAAVNGESDAELQARALALPKSEAMASEKRLRQYTESSFRTCMKAGRDAASNLLGIQ